MNWMYRYEDIEIIYKEKYKRGFVKNITRKSQIILNRIPVLARSNL